MNAPPREERARFQRSREFLRNRLSPNEALGLHVTIGVLVMILGAWWFSEIARDLGPTTSQVALDQRVAAWFHEHTRPELTPFVRAVSWLGSVAALTIVSICCAMIFIAKRAWNRLVALSVTMLGGAMLNVLLKHFFHRQRPVFENPLVTIATFGFPSGHTMGATLLYGLLALIALRFVRPMWQRIAIAAGAAVFIAVIGLTRIYLGAHFLTDVLAAIAIGSAWLAFAWTTAETFRKQRRSRAARSAHSAR
ncbi:MAG TPA: phosphatase PAP2 family protein [Chthoniobacterales bacterium]